MLENYFRCLKLLRSNDVFLYPRCMGVRSCSDSFKGVTSNQTQKYDKLESDAPSFLKVMVTKKSQILEIHKYNPMNVTSQKIKEWKEASINDFEIFKQRYVKERNAILGSDLAAANFIVYRGGKVKLSNSEQWIEMKENEYICEELPTKYVPNLYVECIDVSNTKIRYEGLVNLANLNHLKSLSLRNCAYVDDWFLDKISGEFADTLEHLDISDCSKVTEHGLNGFYRFQKLKKLVVYNLVHNVNFEYRCFLLEDTLPGLSVEGVKYNDIK